jgi:hypothetical protein
MKETRNNLLLQGEDYFYSPEEVTRMNEITEPVSVREWLKLIDFALIRSFYGLNKFDDLFEFLRTKKKIYCAEVEDLKGLLFDIENNDVINDFLRFGILSELFFLFGDFDKGLQCLGKLNDQFSNTEKSEMPPENHRELLKKYKNLYKYTFERAIIILFDNEKQPNFFKTLVRTLLWIRTNKAKMQDLFTRLTFNEQSIKEMRKQLNKIENEEVKLSIWDMFVKKLFETEGLNHADINSEFLIKNLESLNDKSAKLGYERTLKILQDKTRVFDYFQVYDEFLNFLRKLEDKTIKPELKRLILMIEIEILKNMDQPKYHRIAIDKMLKQEEYEMAENYCASYEGKEEEEDQIQDEQKTDNYFGM